MSRILTYSRLLSVIFLISLFGVGNALGEVIWQDDFSTDTGWTGYSADLWERLPAAASTGCSYGADPAQDHSASSDNTILGFNIGGCYSNSISAYTITSPVIDCTGYTGVQMQFFRVLGVESSSYDDATLEAFDGTSWQILYANPASSFADTTWTEQLLDVSTLADNNPGFQIRYTMGAADSSINGCGWNIDDVLIYTFDDYCVNMSPLSSAAAGVTGSTAIHGLNLINCGTENDEINLAIIGGAWTTDITDESGNPIASLTLNAQSTQGFQVRVIVGSEWQDSCVLRATNTVKATQIDVPIMTARAIYFNDFSTDPVTEGWTGFAADQWEWGPATASSGCTGNQDPSSDHSSTSDNNLLGYNIGGCYTNSMGELFVVSPPIDCSDVIDIQLSFYRWLGVESASYDHASVQYSIDGSTWNTVWTHVGSSFSDTTWMPVSYMLPLAGGQENVQLRFSMGPADSSVVYCGWNIDDITMFGSEPGFVTGLVSDASKAPIENARVEVEGLGITTFTNSSGVYNLTLAAGTYTLNFSATGHNDASVSGVAVTVGSTTTANAVLTYPIMQYTPNSFVVNLEYGQTATETLTLTNLGNGPLDFDLSIDMNADRDQWDVIDNIPIDDITSNNRHLSADFINDHFFVFSANPLLRANFIYEIDRSGVLVNTYPQGTSSDWGMRDAASDGTYLYAGDENGFYRFDPDTGTVTTLFTGNLGLGCIRALAYYPPNDSFIATNWGSSGEPFIEFTRDGTQIRSFGASWSSVVGRYGLAYDEYSTGGPFLWIFDQSGTPATSLFSASIETPGSESLTGFSYQIPTLPGGTAEGTAGGLFITTSYESGLACIGGVLQDTPDQIFLLELAPYSTWLSLDPTSGSVGAPPDPNSINIDVMFDSTQVPGPGSYYAQIVIAHNSGDETPVSIPVTMSITGGGNLSGHVFDDGRAPVEGAIVEITELGIDRTTNAEGLYEFINIIPGTYEVTAEAFGYNPAAVTGVVVSPNQTTVQDFHLTYPVMAVDPTEFFHYQMPDTTETLTNAVRLNNQGTGPFSWTSSITYLSAPTNLSRDLSVLIITPDIAGGGTIDNLLNALSPFSDLSITVWDAATTTPTVSDMLAYNAVLVGNDILWTSSMIDPTQLSNNLADYIDAGGGVVASGFVWSYDEWGFGGGRFLTAGYSPFTMATQDFWTPTSLGTYDPAHPVMAGVSTITDNFNHQDPGLAAGAVLVASWADTQPFVAVYEKCVAFNQMYCHTSDFGGDVGQLIYNAIGYVSGGGMNWLATSSSSGSVPAGGQSVIDLTFDTTELIAGEYTANIEFASEPGDDVQTTLVHLFVGTSSPTPDPSNPPTSTPTQMGPTPTPTPSPSGTTPTPTETVPAPTNTPEPPCTQLGVSLEMPSDLFNAGDTCYLTAFVCNTSETTLENIPTFAVLEITGSYWFWPTWGSTPEWVLGNYPNGQTTIPIIEEFSWPEFSPPASNIHFYAAILDVEMTQIIGEMGLFTFGWQ